MATSIRATLIELFSRIIPLKEDKKDGDVYWNDVDNLYPNRIERIVNNSPTASRASKIMGKYISGKGLVLESQDVIVNKAKNYKLSNVISICGQNMAKQGGVFIHVGFGLNDDLTGVVPRSLDVLDYTKCRIAKEDDDKYDGKIFYRDYCEKKSFGNNKKTEEKWFYPFNKNQDVILSQIKADYEDKKGEPTENIAEMLPYYKGQVFYLNLTPEYKYALAPIDSNYNDADTEYRISLYENREVRGGFLGKTAIITQGLDEETAKQVNENVGKWLGADGEDTDGIFRLDLENVEDVTKVMHTIQLKPNLDPKLFSEMKRDLKTTILGAFNSIPEILVLSNSGTVFGTSGEAYEQAKIFYNEQTSDERWKLSETITYLGFPCEILPIVNTDVVMAVESDKTADAQAELKGSVGGVTALIELQKSVSQGYTQRNSAIEIVKVIYGIDEATASIMIGDPVKTAPLTE